MCSRHFFLNFTEELDDFLDRHADALVVLVVVLAVAVVHASCRLVLARVVGEKLESDLWMRLEDLAAVVVDPLFGAAGLFEDLDGALA